MKYRKKSVKAKSVFKLLSIKKFKYGYCLKTSTVKFKAVVIEVKI